MLVYRIDHYLYLSQAESDCTVVKPAITFLK